jgi:hypothetical protein
MLDIPVSYQYQYLYTKMEEIVIYYSISPNQYGMVFYIMML